jgi:uncharacterized membrane protein YjjB (DUF3815 family)
MMELIVLLEKGIWFGLAAIGFGVLFNVPVRTLYIIFILGCIGGLVKVFMVHFNMGVILSSFAGASMISVLSIPAAHNKHAPPLVFSIPALIPMVPGAFAYRTMLGLIKLTGSLDASQYTNILDETVSNGLKTVFILLTLAAGASIPMLVTRKSSAKHIKLKSRD